MTKQHGIGWVLLLAVLLAGLGCREEKRKSRPKNALACVNDECLTEAEIEYQFPDLYPSSLGRAQKKEYVRQWIRSEILYQAAKRQKLDQDKKVRSLAREKIKDILVNEFIERRLKDRIQMTEEEARVHFQENRNMYVWQDDHVRLSHIFTKSMAGATLADLLLKEGNEFEDVVSRTSEDADTKTKGGDLGLVKIKDLSPEIREYAAKLMIGETSPPIPTLYGYEIVKVTDRRRKGAPMRFEWAKNEIIKTLTLQRRQEEIDALFKQAAQKAQVETFDWASGISLDGIR